LTAAIVTASIVAQEIEQKTIVYLVTRPVPRWKLAIFRYLACSVVVTLSVAIDALLVSFGTYGAHGNEYLLKDLMAVGLGAFAYCSLFMLVGMLFNRAMIICLLFAFGWEWAVPKMPGQMSYLSINSYVQAIAQHPTTDQGSSQGGVLASALASSTITATEGYLALAGIIVVCAAFAAFWFATNEYLPREDAE
jgi:ABC-2 type transport system permease protein